MSRFCVRYVTEIIKNNCLEFMRLCVFKLLVTLLVSLACFLPMGEAFAGPRAFEDWTGEYFDQKEGGFYLKIRLKKFKSSKQTNYLTGNIQILLYNILKKQSFLLSHNIAGIKGYPAELWKAPSGKYQVLSVTMVDTAGVKRVWKSSKKKKTLIVKRQRLSNMGVWTISPKGKKKLKVLFAMKKNSYTENSKKSESSVAAVINGFNGVIQEKFAGKKIREQAADNYDRLASVSFTRQIEMYYALNLFKHNYRAQSVADVLKVYESNMRKCYTDRLRRNDNLRGTVKYRFLLSKSTGTMAKIKNAGGTAAGDEKLVTCLYYELGHIQFPIQETMVGELTYTFGVLY
jgi:hypothetical protein